MNEIHVAMFNGLLSVKMLGEGIVGAGEVIERVEQHAAEYLPEGYQLAWTGKAFQVEQAGTAAVFAFSLAVAMVFLILAAPISNCLQIKSRLCSR